ncbi:hypothetical protein [Nonomuraea rubra]|uniref:Multidrug resistance efflux pump n=1 Tax=Nonomuraea rubra TaxID=46180 RepID=A0A7X0P6I5_9ACTN|nr:hypothetical protein [Nonomuraea rubra]MBB6556190.1 multidrug resistance efflux pump [Nonomuraea rubra]
MTTAALIAYGVLAFSAAALVFSIHTLIQIRRSAKETIANWKRAEESWKSAEQNWKRVAEINKQIAERRRP